LIIEADGGAVESSLYRIASRLPAMPELTRRCFLVLLVTVFFVPHRCAGLSRPGAGFHDRFHFLRAISPPSPRRLFVLLTWPVFRWVLRAIFPSEAFETARAKRVVIVGLDGQDQN